MTLGELERARGREDLVVAKKGNQYLVGRIVARFGSFFRFRSIGGEVLSHQPVHVFSPYLSI